MIGLLLKTGQDDQPSNVRDEEFDQIRRMIRCWECGVLSTLILTTAGLSRPQTGHKYKKKPTKRDRGSLTLVWSRRVCHLSVFYPFLLLLFIFFFLGVQIYSGYEVFVCSAHSFPQSVACLFIFLMSFDEQKLVYLIKFILSTFSLLWQMLYFVLRNIATQKSWKYYAVFLSRSFMVLPLVMWCLTSFLCIFPSHSSLSFVYLWVDIINQFWKNIILLWVYI